MTTDTGGSAYPNQPLDRTGAPCMEHQPGLSWLDSCAMKAMQAALMPDMTGSQWRSKEDMASWAYDTAAAMLAEKRRREGGQA